MLICCAFAVFAFAVFVRFRQDSPYLFSMASLDMSLDDMIKSRKNTVKGGRGQGRPRRGRGGPGGPARGGRAPFGAPRRNPLGLNARPSAHTIAKASSMSYALHRQISYDVVPQ